MPTDGLSLLLFLAFLLPGFVFLTRTETRVPGQTYTVLRETGVIATASLLCEGPVLGLVILVHWGTVGHVGPDFRAAAIDPRGYLRASPGAAWGWTTIVLGLSTVAAYFAAVPPAAVVRRLRGDMREWAERRTRPMIRPESGWVSSFTRYPECEVHLSIRLTDGAYLQGKLSRYSTQIEETQDRSLELTRPVRLRTTGAGADFKELPDGVVVVSEREISFLGICYVPATKNQ